MKIKASKKEFKGLNVLSVGYCKLQYLLSNKQPFAYSSGVYGWACDYYDLGNIIISTGYSPTGKASNASTLQEYENNASKILYNSSIERDTKTKLLENLLNDFLNDSNIYA